MYNIEGRLITPRRSVMVRATLGELHEVEDFLFGAHLGIHIGRLYALVRDPVMHRLNKQHGLWLHADYFYQMWEIAGEKIRWGDELSLLETVWLRWFEGLLRRMGAKVRDMDLDQFFDRHGKAAWLRDERRSAPTESPYT